MTPAFGPFSDRLDVTSPHLNLSSFSDFLSRQAPHLLPAVGTSVTGGADLPHGTTIVAIVLPLAFALRQTWLYRRLALPVGSTAVALLALAWCLERGLNINLLPQASAARDVAISMLVSR